MELRNGVHIPKEYIPKEDKIKKKEIFKQDLKKDLKKEEFKKVFFTANEIILYNLKRLGYNIHYITLFLGFFISFTYYYINNSFKQ